MRSSCAAFNKCQNWIIIYFIFYFKNEYSRLFICILGRKLSDELILKILFEFGGYTHPPVKMLKRHVVVEKYREKGIFREFGQIWYDTDNPDRFLKSFVLILYRSL